ncbi:SUF system NifU family Fe-S cluster assembly protein [Anaerococcus sp. AGMB00486]|uniref:SUF system NifU family Fe-S cluster assembly protein n=2 Tax=Anaerococcus TaxID=165779 RepID=A0ABX2NAN6_9FIRM|nr:MULTISPECIES: SUF system NifU family Fe-S cluster assembly protein [Anaerococcus]MDY3006920.1 SUF system NifU family Fe-S cluster assembly protein [Anaerococcus porci]MSS78528.1 SUF system NifU family Fe-S cluster assembly protein [Anaerococcus porci]NVF11748.1 SUF system NifU family Fe-S cluster assembly protein [Anaerococcus faecalis]
MDLNDIYTQVILENSRNPRNKRTLEAPDIKEPGHNPSCGDEIVLELKYDEDKNKITDAAFTGHGCAISQAATSVMCDEIVGKTLEEAKEMAKIYIAMIKREDVSDEDLEKIGDAAAFQNISNMPQRVKCALLSWKTLEEVIEKDEK